MVARVYSIPAGKKQNRIQRCSAADVAVPFRQRCGSQHQYQRYQLSGLHLSGHTDHVGAFWLCIFWTLYCLGPKAGRSQSCSGSAGVAHQYFYGQSTGRLHGCYFADSYTFHFFVFISFSQSLGNSDGIIIFADNINRACFSGIGYRLNAGESGRLSGRFDICCFSAFLPLRRSFSGR